MQDDASTFNISDDELIKDVLKRRPARAVQCMAEYRLPGWFAVEAVPLDMAILPVPDYKDWRGAASLKLYKSALVTQHGMQDSEAQSISNVLAHRMLAQPRSVPSTDSPQQS